MENITEVEVINLDGTTTVHIIIDRGGGAFTSMTKAHYDEQQANQNNLIGGVK
jgi:hypothetical protein